MYLRCNEIFSLQKNWRTRNHLSEASERESTQEKMFSWSCNENEKTINTSGALWGEHNRLMAVSLSLQAQIGLHVTRKQEHNLGWQSCIRSLAFAVGLCCVQWLWEWNFFSHACVQRDWRRLSQQTNWKLVIRIINRLDSQALSRSGGCKNRACRPKILQCFHGFVLEHRDSMIFIGYHILYSGKKPFFCAKHIKPSCPSCRDKDRNLKIGLMWLWPFFCRKQQLFFVWQTGIEKETVCSASSGSSATCGFYCQFAWYAHTATKQVV